MGKELLAGCGYDREKIISTDNGFDWTNLVTLDVNIDCKPDIVYDLNNLPLPFEDNEFSELHFYHILEHLGEQGNVELFFKEFKEYWRILEPNGFLCAIVPSWDSIWAFGDPGHRRVINDGTIMFLSKKRYEENLDSSNMADYRYLLGKADFDISWCQYFGLGSKKTIRFVLKAIK